MHIHTHTHNEKHLTWCIPGYLQVWNYTFVSYFFYLYFPIFVLLYLQSLIIEKNCLIKKYNIPWYGWNRIYLTILLRQLRLFSTFFFFFFDNTESAASGILLYRSLISGTIISTEYCCLMVYAWFTLNKYCKMEAICPQQVSYFAMLIVLDIWSCSFDFLQIFWIKDRISLLF